MNIGSIKQNEAGIFIGRVSTLTVSVTIALREVRSTNPRAPRYEIHALNTASRAWVQVGALFELTARETGEAFLNGKIDDPSLAQPLYISAFRQDDGSYNIVWQRPQRRRDVTAAMTPKDNDDALPPLPGMEDVGAGEAPPAGGGGATDGLGDSTAGDFGGVGTGAARGRGRRGAASDEAREPEMAS
ncbi:MULTISPECIES: DUF736 domain-containing protein [Alphaproteobacteria]|jgi:uncharacterized protein (DUF736 family)|nr:MULTISPECIES: DUF736 domain-containing protein [Alphaproteobacteria]RSV11666.1 DUF736 domain-containing protein [Sphingomonas sp. ABOLF]TAJ29097.1 MAG: DUF736 family protein [Bosea sp. (in: a-proteobacteria)]